MAVVKEIVIKIDDTNAVKGVDNVDKSLTKLDKSQEKVAKSSEKVTKAKKRQTTAAQKQAAGFEAVNKATGGAIRGFRALLKQMWLIVANPVGLVITAIVLGLTALYKAFASTKAGAEQLDQVMAGVGAAIDVVRDRVLKIGEALVKFFKGDFKGAMEAGKASVSGFGAEVAKEFKIAADAKRDLQEVTDAMRELSVTRAALNRDLKKAKETIESSTASYADKKKAIDEVRIAETKQTDEELANARKKLAAIEAQNAQSDSGAEDLDKAAQARIAVIDLERVSSENKTKFAKLEEMADNERIAKSREIAAAKEEEYKAFVALSDANLKRVEAEDAERLKKQEQDAEDLILYEENLNAEEELEIAAEDRRLELAAKKAKAEEKEKNDSIKRAEDEANAKAKAQFMLASQIGNALGQISQLFEQGTAASKTAALAEVVIGTGIGFIQALDIAQKSAKGTGPAAAFAFPIFYASQIAAVLGAAGQAKNILSTAKGGGSVGSTPSVSSSTPSSSSQQAPDFNVVGTSGVNQLADVVSTQAPVKAYVVSNDVTTTQALDRNIETTAVVG